MKCSCAALGEQNKIIFYGSFFIAVFIVDADEGASEGEYLTKGDEHGVVYLTHRRAEEATREQCAPEGAHCSSDDELQAFH